MEKRTMKKVLAAALATAMVATMAGCGGSGSSKGSDASADTSKKVTSVSDIAINEPGVDATGYEDETAPEGVQAGTEFHYWSNYDIPIYCPWMDNRAAVLSYQIYSNLLVKYKGDRNDIRGDLAESYEVSDDGLVWTFKLREDAKFSDGCAVEAEDFIATWDVMQQYQPRPFSSVASYEAVDAHTLKVTLSAPNPTFIYELPSQRIYGVVCKDELEKYGPEDNRSAVGTGPFYVEEYKTGESFKLKAVEDYWNEDMQAHIETVYIDIIADENTALMGLMDGSINCMNTVDIEIMNNVIDNDLTLALIEDRENPFWLNAAKVEVLKDPIVREALCHMVNWDDLSALVYDGLYPHPNSYFTGEEAPEYSSKYDYDPDLGVKMLEDAGYKLSDIKFEILADPDFTNLEVAMVQQFNDLGLTGITTVTYDGATCYGMLKSGTYDSFPCHNGYDPESPLTPFTMGLIEGGTQPCMFLKAADPDKYAEAEALYNAAATSGDLETFNDNMNKLENLVQEECLALGGLQVIRGYAFTSDVRGAYISPVSSEIQMSFLYMAE
ncbi:MAG: ABC transporter substrate-binding protein [Hespellia sp.]|nr:ABC transporter substrate-binding protein [Hespellia sp.]